MKSDVLQIGVIGFVIAATVSFFVAPYRIEGKSMLPTLKHGQFVFVNKVSNPKIGDVVVAKTSIGTVAKRITKIMPEGFWLEGDNKQFSSDSREFGAISKKQIVGKVIGF